MNNTIKVGMADLNALYHPGVLTTLGLGSCVGVAIFNRYTRIIGLAHVMLPYSAQASKSTNAAKFADTAIQKLVEKMIGMGAKKEHLIAKLTGGAQMFAFNQYSDIMRIGYRNITACREKLEEMRIPIVSEDTGGNYGRTIELYSDTGRLLVKTIGYGTKEI